MNNTSDRQTDEQPDSTQLDSNANGYKTNVLNGMWNEYVDMVVMALHWWADEI